MADSNERINPFEALKRKRLPGMHMILARNGGMPLRDALASFFFVMLHDKLKGHECLIEKALKEEEERAQQATNSAKSPDGAVLLHLFQQMGSSSIVQEEWSYLGEDDTLIFYLLADVAISSVRKWNEDAPNSEHNSNDGQYIKKLLAEIEATSTPS